MKENKDKIRLEFDGNKVFTFEEVMEKGNLSRSELWNLKNTSALQYTLVYDMFKFIHDERSCQDILTECKTTKEWYMKHTWTLEENNNWRNTHGIPMLKRIFGWSKGTCERELSWFLLGYGFMISDYDDKEKHE